MRKALLILCAVCGLLPGCNENNNEPAVPQEPEVTLFDKNVMPAAYINYADNDTAIYMWDGTPVAYLDKAEEIYHFNGRFLGWYTDGVLYDKDGYAVAARKGIAKGEIMTEQTYAETVKAVKHVQPVRHVQSLPPAKPLFRDQWSVSLTSLYKFFLTEVTLFDKDKEATAYIDYADDSTIYMWNGTAVAYVENEKKIYRFDGRFLGWYTDGILYGKDGYAVGAQNGIVKGAISMTAPHPEPAKSPKSRKPDREIQSAEPAFPHFENSWSETSLSSFFTFE